MYTFLLISKKIIYGIKTKILYQFTADYTYTSYWNKFKNHMSIFYIHKK